MSKEILIRKVIVEKKMDIPPFSRKEFEEYLVTIGLRMKNRFNVFYTLL